MMRGAAYTGMALVLLAGAGCERREAPPEETRVGTEAPGWSPEAQMRATLSDLIHAQQRHYAELERYADNTAVLIEEFDFTPVGDATVTISFIDAAVEPEPDPEGGYLAVALHPLSDQRCEVQHTISPLAGRETVGEIVCVGAGN
jgi:hypothetical protein